MRVRQGICGTPAMLIQARQPVGGILGKLFGRRSVPEDRAWLLPNGKSAEQWGERQTDLILVWAEDDSNPLDEPRIKSQWPESKEFQTLGKNLFLVSGIEPPPPPKIEREQAPPQGCPRPVAEQLLADARQRGDRRKEAAALLDLGIIHRQEGDPKRALVLLEEALPITRELAARSGEREVLGQLGLASLALGQARRALERLEQELAYARETGEPYG